MILVTGGTGCLGGNLTRALLKSESIVAVLKLPNDPAIYLRDLESRIDWRLADLRDPISLRNVLHGIDQIYHVAGIASPFNHQRQAMESVNVQGTRYLLNTARESGVKRIVYTSSIAAIGYPDGIADETFDYNGAQIDFAYMHTKRAAEAIVQQFVNDGMDIVIVNPSAVLAPYCDAKQGWGRVMLDVHHGRVPFVPDGGIAVLTQQDFVQGMLRAMAHGRRGERYILSSMNVDYHTLLATMAAVCHVAPPTIKMKRASLKILATVFKLFQPLLHKLAPESLLTHTVLSLMWRRIHYQTAKAQAELGFVPQQPLADSLAETWQYLLTHHTAALAHE